MDSLLQPAKKRSSPFWTGFWLCVLLILGYAFFQRQAVLDWLKLHNYVPPSSVSQIVQTDTMTPYAQHLFYVNHPQLLSDRTDFTTKCSVNVEKTVILGCYQSGDNGIYVYKVSDPRLEGVIPTTAAHEMLHAAYARLSHTERTRVDAMLQDFYQHGLKDERLLKTIDAYRQSGADVTNEMHSIFATEVAVLPPNLEQYYTRYFNNRQSVIVEEQKYEAEFTSREAKVHAYDEELKQLKLTIDHNTAALTEQSASLDNLNNEMIAERGSGQISTYNANVPVYNAKVDAYNQLLDSTRQDISQYNLIVEARNALATEEQQLVQDLSGTSLPSQK